MVGATDRFEVFDRDVSLAARLDEVPQTRFIRTYAEVLEQDADGDLARAVRSLLERTDSDPPAPGMWSQVRARADNFRRRHQSKLRNRSIRAQEEP